jgi:hypothetical protein
VKVDGSAFRVVYMSSSPLTQQIKLAFEKAYEKAREKSFVTKKKLRNKKNFYNEKPSNLIEFENRSHRARTSIGFYDPNRD